MQPDKKKKNHARLTLYKKNAATIATSPKVALARTIVAEDPVVCGFAAPVPDGRAPVPAAEPSLPVPEPVPEPVPVPPLDGVVASGVVVLEPAPGETVPGAVLEVARAAACLYAARVLLPVVALEDHVSIVLGTGSENVRAYALITITIPLWQCLP